MHLLFFSYGSKEPRFGALIIRSCSQVMTVKVYASPMENAHTVIDLYSWNQALYFETYEKENT